MNSNEKLAKINTHSFLGLIRLSERTPEQQNAIDKYMKHGRTDMWQTTKKVKSVLGKQDYVWNGNGRCHIWEREFTSGQHNLHWRVWGTSTGTSLEIQLPDGMDTQHINACQIMNDGIENFLMMWNSLLSSNK